MGKRQGVAVINKTSTQHLADYPIGNQDLSGNGHEQVPKKASNTFFRIAIRS